MKHIILDILTYIFKISLKFFYYTLSKTNDFIIDRDNCYLIPCSNTSRCYSLIDILQYDYYKATDICLYEKKLIKRYNITLKYRCNTCGKVFDSKSRLNIFGCDECC